MTRQKYVLKTEEYDALFDHLSQFEPHVKASKAKKAARNHDPLALVANSNAHSLNSYASSSFSRSPQPYYVTHPLSVIDNDDDYQGEIQGDAQEDKLIIAMMLLARAIIQRYSTPTNNRNGNKNVGRQNRNQVTNAGNGFVQSIEENDHNVQRHPRTKEQMLLALKDEARAHLDDKENDFMLDNAYGDNTLEELNAAVNASKVDMINGLLSKSDHEQRHREKLKTIIHTSADDQIDSDIIFDDPYMNNNSGQAEHDTNAHVQSLHDFESLIINVQVEAEKQRKKNIELQKQKSVLSLNLLKKGRVNTKFDKSTTLEKLICVTALNKNKDLKTKIVSKVEVKTNKSKPVTSCSTPINEQGVASSSSVSRPESKDTNSKKKVLLNTKSKSTSKDVKKSQSSFTSVSIKNDTMHSNVSESKANVLKAKTVNALHDGLNLVCVSCGKDVFLIAHDKCVARYGLSPNSRVKRALFTSLVVAKSSKLGATPVVVKSRFSVATPSKATNKVSRVSSLTPESRQSKTLSTYVKNKIATSRKWQKWFEHQSSFNWSPKSSTAQKSPSVSKSSPSARTNSKTLVTTQKWVAKLSTPPSEFVSCDAVRFGNDNFTAITGYGDYVQGNLTICHVYYVEGLRHNLFSVGQFCGRDLEVAFRSNTCYVRNLEGEDLLTGSCDFNLYTISISEMAASSLVCLLFKYDKDHLCSACEQGKSKKAIFPPKLIPSTTSKLELLHMDLCGLMRTKDETPEMIIKFITQIQRNMKVQALKVRSDNGTEFKNEKLRSYYEKLGIMHQTSISRSPQQNGVVERRNRTLVDAARTMLIFLRLPEFLWAEAISTACFTQNHSLVHTRYNKTPYGLIKDRKPNVQYFHVFGSLCCLTNDHDDLGKMKPKADIGIFVDYSESSRGTRSQLLEFLRFMSETPSKEDLDNLFGPLYKEYYAMRTPEVSDNSVAYTLNNEDTPSSSSIIIKDHDAPHMVSSSEEPIAQEPTSPVFDNNSDE
ncbi:retrovirus-related pol polyprotein from transposon TNT 1-94 [Tanacetum coccineum]